MAPPQLPFLNAGNTAVHWPFPIRETAASKVHDAGVFSTAYFSCECAVQVLNDTDAMATNPVVHAASSSSDAAFWIEKFMKTAFQEKDPELMGHNNDITPLAVVAAARWRKTLADVQREEALQLEKAALAEESRLHELKSRSEGTISSSARVLRACAWRP